MSNFFNRIWHGAAYYPELWKNRIDQDIGLMKQVGIDLVRIGEFAWSSMEPREGEYDLGWLAEVFDKCSAAGIGIVLCTPTPTPPRWLTLKYPQVLRVDVDGRPWTHGSRQHVSHTSPKYRQLSRKITAKLARTFGRHPALVAWQTDNEFLCHVDGDFSESSRKAWHAWLKARYKTIRNLNQQWASAIWSEDYPSFGAVPMPTKTPFGAPVGSPIGVHHVSLQADWHRFVSDTVVQYQRDQLDIIRKHSDAPITHNLVNPDRVFPDEIFGDLDFCATDPYVAHTDVWRVFHRLDWMRGAKMRPDGSTVPYAIMETSPSHNGSRTPGHLTHPRGFLAAEAAIFLGMGGNVFSYWLWQQQRSGVEMCHGAVITSWGTPSVGFNDVQAVSQLLAKIQPILLALPPARAQVAVHDSINARAILRAEPLWDQMNLWRTPVEEIHRPLLEMGLWRDVRFEDADVSAYKVVLSPFMPAITDSLLARMEKFVRDGGLWIVGPMSGCRTPHGTVPTDAGLGKLDALAGVKTLWPVGIHTCRGSLADQQLDLGWYCFGLEPAAGGCVALGRYLDGAAQDVAWCVQRPLGRGRIVVLGAHAPGQYGKVLDALLGDVVLERHPTTWGTTLIPRQGNGQRAWIIANWDGKGGSAKLPAAGRDVVTGRAFGPGDLRVEPFGVHVVVVGS
jgi:beta-galactosidase